MPKDKIPQTVINEVESIIGADYSSGYAAGKMGTAPDYSAYTSDMQYRTGYDTGKKEYAASQGGSAKKSTGPSAADAAAATGSAGFLWCDAYGGSWQHALFFLVALALVYAYAKHREKVAP